MRGLEPPVQAAAAARKARSGTTGTDMKGKREAAGGATRESCFRRGDETWREALQRALPARARAMSCAGGAGVKGYDEGRQEHKGRMEKMLRKEFETVGGEVHEKRCLGRDMLGRKVVVIDVVTSCQVR